MISAQSARPDDRHIAWIGSAPSAADPAAQAMDLFGSMLWALQGTTRAKWTSVPSAEAADVVVLLAAQAREHADEWRDRGKAVIVIATDTAAVPAHENVLVYPFRVTDVRQMLNALDERLSAGVSEVATPEGGLPRDRWSFLRQIQTLREVKNGKVWLVGKAADGSPILWMRGDGSEYSAEPEMWRDIRQGRVNFHDIKLQAVGSLPAHRTARTAVELNWFAGYHADSQLAPWLRPFTPYRVSRWPNFGVIRPTSSQLRITAMLAEAPQRLQEIATRGRVPFEEAIRTLNALTACDLLVEYAEAPEPAREPIRSNPLEGVSAPVAGFKAFFHLVRRRLGLSVSP